MTARQPRGRTARDAGSAGSSGAGTGGSATTGDASGAPDVRYADALEELEKILEDLENDAIDVDDLTMRVKRASELIVLCRDRLTRTKVEIEQIVANLEGLGEDEERDAAYGEERGDAEDAG